MKIWGVTDVGLVRKENQDTFAVCELSQPGHSIAVVCDGMGGAKGGQTASRIAADTYLESMRQQLTKHMDAQQLLEVSAQAVKEANAAVYQRSQEVESLHGMGTTLITAVTYAEGAVITNVGDSRAYFLNAQGIRQISRDHSVVEKLVELGDITHEEARCHPNRNLITRALGPDPSIQCDGFVQPLKSGERILLCSDGLVDELTDEEIFTLAQAAPGPESIAQCLVDRVKELGAGDNVTVVLLQKE